jgi:hypothetical protein
MLGLLGILTVLELATMLMSAEGFMLIFITMIYAISACLLAGSQSVKAFLNYQRKRTQQGTPSEGQQADVQETDSGSIFVTIYQPATPPHKPAY